MKVNMLLKIYLSNTDNSWHNQISNKTQQDGQVVTTETLIDNVIIKDNHIFFI